MVHPRIPPFLLSYLILNSNAPVCGHIVPPGVRTGHLQAAGADARVVVVIVVRDDLARLARPLHHVVVRLTEQAVLAERELVAGDQLPRAGHAAETVDVEDLTAGAHHEVALTKSQVTFSTLGPE